MGPLDRLINEAVRCGTCGAKLGACDCAEKRREQFLDDEYKRLMKLSDDDLIAEAEALGIEIEIAQGGIYPPRIRKL